MNAVSRFIEDDRVDPQDLFWIITIICKFSGGDIYEILVGVDPPANLRRAGSPATKIPGFTTLLRNKSAIITNWASFYRDVALHTDPKRENSETCKPSLHLPIMEPDGLITSVWNNGIVFCPRAGEIGMLMITRRFDSDALTEAKRESGSRVPMGARLI